MEYYFLDQVPWRDSQSLYHAAAYLGREALFILRPSTPYVCLGFHQDARKEIDLEFADRERIPVLRREVGGGAVYLDNGQLFYQLILRKDRPDVPVNKAQFFEKFLQPVVQTYRSFGVPAEYRPVNDILSNGRKVSGTGAAEIGESVVLVGNFLLDFNYEMMAKVLRVPDEKFRDKVYKTLSENLTTFRRETGDIPKTRALAEDLRRRYEALFGPFDFRENIDLELRQKADQIIESMDNPEWLLANDQRQFDDTRLKIREGIYVLQKVVKLPGGLVRATAVCQDGVLSDVHLSGDFFIYPQDAIQALERALEGAPVDEAALEQTIQEFYRRNSVESPGITPQALASTLMS
jgi:lipoate-protein ligase A